MDLQLDSEISGKAKSAADGAESQQSPRNSPEASAAGDDAVPQDLEVDPEPSAYFPIRLQQPVEPDQDSFWWGEIIKLKKQKSSDKRGRWAMIECKQAGRTFLWKESKGDSCGGLTPRAGLHVEFTATGKYCSLGGDDFPEAVKMQPLSYKQASDTYEARADIWSSGVVHPGAGVFNLKRVFDTGSETSFKIAKDYFHRSGNSYLRRNTPVNYTTYMTDAGVIGAVVHGHDIMAMRNRATNQVSGAFVSDLSAANEGAFLLGGLNCPRTETTFPLQIPLYELLLDSPDFSRIQLGMSLDKLRDTSGLSRADPTPTVYILSEGRTIADWHTAINKHLDSYPYARTRDKDTTYVLLLQAPQSATAPTLHAFLPLGMMHDQHLATNHATKLTLIEGGVQLGTRGEVGQFKPEFMDGKLLAIHYAAAGKKVNHNDSLVGVLHGEATSISTTQLLSNLTSPAPAVLALPDSLSELPSSGMLITYPRGQRNNVEAAVNHITNVSPWHSPFFVPDYKIEGAIYTGPVPWHTVADQLNVNHSMCAMSLAALVNSNSWSLHLSEGHSISHRQI